MVRRLDAVSDRPHAFAWSCVAAVPGSDVPVGMPRRQSQDVERADRRKGHEGSGNDSPVDAAQALLHDERAGTTGDAGRTLAADPACSCSHTGPVA